MNAPFDEALQAFIGESRELLQQMEEALLRVEQQPGEAETLHAIFRAAHTIKGSAGVFGLDPIVAFTHVAESVLDRVRHGVLRFDASLVSLLLSARDHLGVLIDRLDAGEPADEATGAAGAAIAAQLAALLGDEAAGGAVAPVVAPGPAAWIEPLVVAPGRPVNSDLWHVSIRFGPEMFRDGFDPLSFVRYLGTLGRLAKVVALVDNVPCLADLQPDACHWGFEIGFESHADKAAIEGVFEFVREGSRIRILPPHSKLGEYQALIDGLAEAPLPLGEILVRCGTLTEAELAEALNTQAHARAQGEVDVLPLGGILLEQALVRPEVVEAALQKQAQSRAGGEAATVRVDAAKLDRLIDLVGELVIASTGATLTARRHQHKDMVQAAGTVARLVEEVRDSALTLRMVAIGATLNRFHRLVRDAGRELGKDIQLLIAGAETELDKTMVERLADPLTHLVRNAIDHGIGLPEVRMAKGKPAQGTLRLNAYHDAGSVVIEVADDGSGLKTERIEQRALARGLIAPGHGLSDHALHQLIFEPGFSTAETISNLSGRGVGMDVVKRTITDLRGSIDLHSVDGAGTTVRIRLPLTLAIIDGFLVGVGTSNYVLPLDMVVECLELPRGEADGRDYLDLRGELLPLIRLRDAYGIDGARARRESVVVVQAQGCRAGLVVDQLQGELQTVIKPLGRLFQGMPDVGGFTILGNGAVALLLDVPGMFTQAADRTAALCRHVPSIAAC